MTLTDPEAVADMAGSADMGLSGPQEVALLARILEREGFCNGYVDGLSGSISYRQQDGTILANPYGIPWSELSASDVVVADQHGQRLSGKWSIHTGATLNFALHRQRSAVVTVHGHPQWAIIWANHHRVPPIYDQTSAKLRGEVIVINEYDGSVMHSSVSDGIVEAMGGADTALLAHHGVLMMGESIADMLTRSLALEARARSAYRTEVLGEGAPKLSEQTGLTLNSELSNYRYSELMYQALARREVRLDPAVLD